VLALEAGRWVERDRLAALLWPEREAGAARRNLRKVVFDTLALPGMAGPGGLQAQAHALRWEVHTDLAAFDAQRQHEPAAALAWRRGLPLQGLDDTRNAAWTEWLAATRTRLEQAWLATALEHACAQPEPEARATAARRVLAVDALDEAALGLLLKAEVACGRLPQAQAEYRRYALRLAQELGVEPSRALREWMQAQGEAAGQSAAAAPGAPAEAARPPIAHPAAPLSSGARAPGPAPGAAATAPLPTGATPFIGRKLELAELRGLLERPECRLVTLLGPGGIGKSRLMLQALAALQARSTPLFPGGHLLLPLHTATSADELPGRWAQALGLTLPAGAEALPALLRQWPPAGQRALLVLDNVEHLAGLPALAQQALVAAPQLVLMATSRSRLALAQEWLLPVPGLALPDEDSRDLEAASAFDAVHLFERCASAARRDFSLAAHLPAVLDITSAVGGLPLAIELAASWVRLLPPEQIAADLLQGIEVLERDPSGPAPTRPEHRSLAAVLDGSWQLLGPHERQALAALSVFEGGFTRAAAQAVAGCSLPLLSALVDASLLAVDDTGRFALHPVVARYAAARLAEQPAQQAALQQRHCAHHACALAALAPHTRGDPRLLVQGVAPEFANHRAAWQHALVAPQPALLAEMVNPWRAFFETTGRLAEGLAQIRPALALPAADDSARRLLCRARHAVSTLLYRQGDLTQSLAIAQAALAPAEAVGERSVLRSCLSNMGLCLWNLGRAAEAQPSLARALALAEDDGDRQGIALVLGTTAIVVKALGRFDEALVLNERALVIERELGNQRGVASKLNNIGNLHRARAQWAQARPWFDEGLRHCHEYGLTAVAPFLQLNLGLTEMELGALASARGHLQAVLDGQRDSGQLQVDLAADLGLARLDIAQARHAEALARLRRVVQRAQARAFHTHPAQAVMIYGELLLARGEHDAAARVWLLMASHDQLDEADRLESQRHLQRLALDAAGTAALQAELPPLAHWLARLQAPHPGLDGG
jgi:predicted ATPase/DNA-binding SARP family transcriptional activator